MDVTQDFLGTEFVWFVGVVEDRNDPLKLGRVRVRVMGWHSSDLQRLPVSALPWANCLLPTTSASVSGIGTSVNLVEGSWVIGFFVDGREAQRPFVLGSFHGIPVQFSDVTKGFNDPNGQYPAYINEPDTNRLSRNENSSLGENKNADRTTGVPTAGGASWSEPPSAYNARYGNNHVTATESGHVFEVDDTPGDERIHEYHKSGTFYEIDQSGNKVTRVVGDNYEIVAGTNYINIKGDCNIKVDGDMDVNVTGNYKLRAARVDIN